MRFRSNLVPSAKPYASKIPCSLVLRMEALRGVPSPAPQKRTDSHPQEELVHSVAVMMFTPASPANAPLNCVGSLAHKLP